MSAMSEGMKGAKGAKGIDGIFDYRSLALRQEEQITRMAIKLACLDEVISEFSLPPSTPPSSNPWKRVAELETEIALLHQKLTAIQEAQ